jgi:long-chain acyl-CoA synthetase
MANMLLHHHLQKWAKIQPNKTLAYSSAVAYSYETVWTYTVKLSEWLRNNTSEGEKVGVVLDNSIHPVICVYAIVASGRVCVPLDTDMHDRNIKYIIDDCSMKYLITNNKIKNRLSLLDSNHLKSIISIDDEASLEWVDNLVSDFDSNARSENHFDDHTSAFVLYTTGTTGPQKGVVLSHYNLLEATRNINEFMQIDSSIVESLPMRLSHSFGFARLRCIVAIGGTVVLEKGMVRPEIIIFNIKKYSVNAISSVPAGFTFLLDYYGRFFKDVGVQIKHIEIGSAFMPMEQKQKLMKYCPNAKICMHYGLTEASRAAFIEFKSEYNKLHTVGRPSPNVEITILKGDDENGLNDGSGEICVKGKMVANHYLGKPEQTKKIFTNGWLHTGDIGKIDDDGYVILLGRKKDIINVGGLKVPPGEVEAILNDLEGVIETAVVGNKSNDINGEIVLAYIVAKNEINQEILKEHCINKLEPYKIPKEFIFVNKLPKTSSGKIQKHKLKDYKID